MKGLIVSLAMMALGGVTAASARSLAPDLPASSEILDGYELPEVEQRLAETALHTVEGLWRFPGEGSVMAVERIGDATPAGGTADIYRMVAVLPVDRAVRPGTVMGMLVATARKDVYDCRLYTSASDDGRVLLSPKKLLIELTYDGTRMSFRPYGKKIRFRWWKMFPYMFSRLISVVETVPDGLDGCVRVFPEPFPPVNPRYL